jgi:tRNA-specific 2-thiouridylase
VEHAGPFAYNPRVISEAIRDIPKGSRILVAMSGGVDSSVAACLLQEAGFDIWGLFMRVGAEGPDEVPGSESGGQCPPNSAEPPAVAKTHQGCCSAADAADARFVAGMLGIPFYALNYKEEFGRIIDYFADEYARGRTPNPCVQCNTHLKFGKLLDLADALGADYVATGHYARLARRDGGVSLLRGVDTRKDQSYFLCGVKADALQRAIFPIGGMTKDEVRAEAGRFGLPVQDKPDSVEICFVPDRDYARVVRQRRPEAFKPGNVVDTAGRTIGRHDGIPNYTIGQRRGLGVAAGKPVYVTSLDVLGGTVMLGERAALLSRKLVATDLNLLRPLGPEPIRCTAKIRYQHNPAACTARLDTAGRLHLEFDESQAAITPGQAVVLYAGDEVLGGASILASNS